MPKTYWLLQCQFYRYASRCHWHCNILVGQKSWHSRWKAFLQGTTNINGQQVRLSEQCTDESTAQADQDREDQVAKVQRAP
jgi:hypothetical protein